MRKMIKVSDLTFRYSGNQHNTLEGINLEIGKGDWIVIKGRSGGGKTTLALALAGYLFHYTNGDYCGRVEIGGHALEEEDFPDIAWLVYLVQQNPENQFCTLTVRDEIAFGLENRNVESEIINQRIEESLRTVKGEHLIDANLLELSGGEKQKVAIATAIALRPEVIILDEPTSNLDPAACREVFEALHQMKEQEDVTVVIIEHKLEQALNFASNVLVLENGKLYRENGKPEIKIKARGKKNHRNSKEQGKQEPIISLHDFKVERQEKTVVNIHKLDVYPGDFIALVGPNGSGKTSLLLGLLNLLKTSEDSYSLLHHPIQFMKQIEIAEQCGYVFQNPDHQLFCGSVEEEVFLAPRNFKKDITAVRSSILDVLKGFGLDDKMEVHPFQLSFGQKKRLNLASVLAYEPRILFLDEIFIGQDKENIDTALNMISAYIETHQAAVILVNHYLKPLTTLANRLVFLDKGRILFDVPMEKHAASLEKFGKYEYLPD